MKSNKRKKIKSRKNKKGTLNLFSIVFIIILGLIGYQLVQAFSDNEGLTNSNDNPSNSIGENSEKNISKDNNNPEVKDYYTSKDFGITTTLSSIDFNSNGIDDYTDILLGAKKEAASRPFYEDLYWEGGYPPDGTGVCTDVIWRAFKHAGYNLKEMVDNDIANFPYQYDLTYGIADPYIDFRRVVNLDVFFSKYAISLTTDTTKISQWQPGDIVVYGQRHIAIISDIRNENGVAYIIHNSDEHIGYEEDFLAMDDLSAHYRFDASKIPENVLIGFD